MYQRVRNPLKTVSQKFNTSSFLTTIFKSFMKFQAFFATNFYDILYQEQIFSFPPKITYK